VTADYFFRYCTPKSAYHLQDRRGPDGAMWKGLWARKFHEKNPVMQNLINSYQLFTMTEHMLQIPKDIKIIMLIIISSLS
jgi:hypothetical protein